MITCLFLLFPPFVLLLIPSPLLSYLLIMFPHFISWFSYSLLPSSFFLSFLLVFFWSILLFVSLLYYFHFHFLFFLLFVFPCPLFSCLLIYSLHIFSSPHFCSFSFSLSSQFLLSFLLNLTFRRPFSPILLLLFPLLSPYPFSFPFISPPSSYFPCFQSSSFFFIMSLFLLPRPSLHFLLSSFLFLSCPCFLTSFIQLPLICLVTFLPYTFLSSSLSFFHLLFSFTLFLISSLLPSPDSTFSCLVSFPFLLNFIYSSCLLISLLLTLFASPFLSPSLYYPLFIYTL